MEERGDLWPWDCALSYWGVWRSQPFKQQQDTIALSFIFSFPGSTNTLQVPHNSTGYTQIISVVIYWDYSHASRPHLWHLKLCGKHFLKENNDFQYLPSIPVACPGSQLGSGGAGMGQGTSARGSSGVTCQHPRPNSCCMGTKDHVIRVKPMMN